MAEEQDLYDLFYALRHNASGMTALEHFFVRHAKSLYRYDTRHIPYTDLSLWDGLPHGVRINYVNNREPSVLAVRILLTTKLPIEKLTCDFPGVAIHKESFRRNPGRQHSSWSTELGVVMPIMEWPLAAACMLWQDEPQLPLAAVVNDAFSAHFPGLTLEGLHSLRRCGVAPEDRDAFVTWLFNFRERITPANLPALNAQP